MIRQILGVILGYVIFVISSIFLFRFSEVNPHEDAPKLFMVLTFVYGTVFSFVSGFSRSINFKDEKLKSQLCAFYYNGWFCRFFTF